MLYGTTFTVSIKVTSDNTFRNSEHKCTKNQESSCTSKGPMKEGV